MPYLYPTNFEMFEILPTLVARGREGRVGLDIFPVTNRNAAQVRWQQMDNYFGLQQMRGLDGAPPHVQRLGFKTYVYEPGVYGEHLTVTETELVTRAGSAPIDTTPIDVSDLVVTMQTQLIGREFDRIEANVWGVLGGTLSVKLDGPNGIQVAYTDTYTVQTYSAPIAWATLSTAVPIKNLQTVQQLSVGYSADFGAGATAYMNQVTANLLLNNSNTADFGGRRTQFGATINNIQGVASYWQSQNLPNIVVYDAGYYVNPGDATSKFVKFIPDNKVFVVGKRPGNANVGEYQMTRNAMNPGFAPGSYAFTKDYAQGINAPKEVPPKIEVHRGHNGGCALLYPSAIVVLNV